MSVPFISHKLVVRFSDFISASSFSWQEYLKDGDGYFRQEAHCVYLVLSLSPNLSGAVKGGYLVFIISTSY